jgi:hypothetical protein
MIRNTELPNKPPPLTPLKRARIAFLLLPLAGMVYLCRIGICIDGCGPYHNRASVADLDGDGDLDVVLSILRHESDTIVWAGATLWINQGGWNFTPRTGDWGGPYTTVGDLDGDGDVDLVRCEYDAIGIHMNYGDVDPMGDLFRVSYQIRPEVAPSNWTANGSIALGDLNNDGRLDAVVSSCCARLTNERDDDLAFVPWMWINTPDEMGYPKGQAVYVYSLGDLPSQAALGDLDGDGDLDIYAASLPPKGGNYASTDQVLLNDGSANFVDSGQRLENPRLAGTAASGAVALGDLDGDGDLDAIAATASGAAIWINLGGGKAGVFASSDLSLGRGYVEAVFLADLDADGDLDALLGEKSPISVWFDTIIADGKMRASIWWNDGQGTFRDSGKHMDFKEHQGLAVGDFNDDGYLDVFAAGGDDLRIWFNRGKGDFQEIRN